MSTVNLSTAPSMASVDKHQHHRHSENDDEKHFEDPEAAPAAARKRKDSVDEALKMAKPQFQTPFSPKFNVAHTFQPMQFSSVRNLRNDIDMSAQLNAIKEHRKDAIIEKDWDAFNTTCTTGTNHLVFMKMLLNEAERYKAKKWGGFRNFPPVVRQRLHAKLMRISTVCEEAMNEDEEKYADCLAFISAHQLFNEVRRTINRPNAARQSTPPPHQQ